MATSIKSQLDPSGKRKIAKAEKFLLAYNNDKSQAEKLENSSQKKLLKKQISASKNLGKANKIMYKVYREDLKKFIDIDKNDSAKVIKKKLVRVKKIMKRTNSKREAALKLTSDDDIYSILKHADELEEKAFKDIYFVYSLLLKDIKPKQDEGKNEVVKVTEDIKDNNIIPVKKAGDDAIKDEGVPVSAGNVENSVDDKKTVNNNEPISELNNDNTKKIADEPVNNNDINTNVYFRIQIAASKSQPSLEQYTKNLPPKEVLDVEIEGEWYKYFISKKFASYQEAQDYKSLMKIKGTLIIAYKNNQKVTIEEALKKEPVDNTKNVVTENKIIDNVKPAADGKITYRLQVGFSTKQLSAVEVSQFKNGGKEVFAIDCGSWFIYTVGDFETEIAAQNFKNAKGLTESEIVKFRNGKPLEE
jgi:hypothetical protein